MRAPTRAQGSGPWWGALPAGHTAAGADSAGTAARGTGRGKAPEALGRCLFVLGVEIPNHCCLGGCCRLPVLLALCSVCHLSADGDLSPPPLLTPFAADRHIPAARSLLSAASPLSLLLLLCILLQLSGGERAGSRCLCDDTRKKALSVLFRRQVFLFVCLRFVDRNGCIKNKY